LLRREYNRFIVNASADLSGKGPLIVQDLCGRGAGVVGNFPLDINAPVEITISPCFAISNPVNIKARVAWCRQLENRLWQAGLDFGLTNELTF